MKFNFFWFLVFVVLSFNCKDNNSTGPLPNPNVPEVPVLFTSDTSKTGNYIIRWTTAKRANGYTLQEDQDPSFPNAIAVYTGIDTTIRISAKPFGKVFYYHVRANNNEGSSNWSNTKSVIVIQLPAPNLSIANTNLSFGDVLTGQLSASSFSVSNNGNAELWIQEVLIDNVSFNVLRSLPFRVLPATSETFGISFSPAQDGTIAATMIIKSDDPDDYPPHVSLSGKGVHRAILTISPPSLSFGQVPLDSTRSLSLIAKNTGNKNLSIQSAISNNSYFDVRSATPLVIAPNDSFQIFIDYTPTLRGLHNAQLNIQSTDSLNPLRSIAMNGQGIGPSISVQPSNNVNFGDIPVWTSADTSFLVINAGERELDIQSISTNSTQFILLSSTSFSLAAGTNRIINLRFTPTSEGTQSGIITFHSNDRANDPLNINLTGYGAKPHISVSPPQLIFGHVEITQSSTLPFTIQNVGRAPLTVYSVLTDSPAFSTSFLSQLTLAPNAQATFQASFSPYRLDEQLGNVITASNDSSKLSVSIPLSGFGETHLIIENKSSMLTGRSNYASAVIGSKIFITGGFSYSSSQTLSSLEVYDTLTNTWTLGASLDTARQLAGGATVANKFYVLGGANGSGTEYYASTRIYDPSSNTWSTGSPMPTPRQGFATAVMNGKIYTFGGTSRNSLTPVVEEYDPSTNSWTQKAQLPTSRWIFQAEELNGKIYVIGGSIVGGTTNIVEIYDPATNSWSTGTPLPKSVSGLALSKAHGRLLAFSGEEAGSVDSKTIYEFNPLTSAWLNKGELSSAKIYANGCAVGNKIFLVGGFCCNNQQLNTNVMVTVLP